ncbi:MAG: DUF3604 domain-containing protein [Candidatus Hydrogenedentes bacterium]|nr:DUF3604 domain-containing protein [Candidatus Hydrogenedentota bacterium]
MKTLFFAGGIALLASLTHAQEIPAPIMVPDAWVDTGSATISPDSGISGEYGTWTVSYTVGKGGIAGRGGIRVQLPVEWHSGPRNSAVRLQTKDSARDNYITANCSNTNVTIRCIVEGERDNELIKHAKKSLDGRNERYVFVVRVVVTEGALNAGDTINVVYGDTSGGSRGYRASAVSAHALPILIALDHDGDNRFETLNDSPTIAALPGKAVYAQVHALSNAITGEPMKCRVVILDKEFNPAAGPANFTLSYPKGVTGPESTTIYRDHSWSEFAVTPSADGVVRINAHWTEANRKLLGNPTEVAATLPERALYWGDLHSHTNYSWDGVGRDAFSYARNVSGLDFYAMTDHAIAPQPGWTRGLSEKYWAEYNTLTRVYNLPGKFVTLHAYECSFGTPYGHHNVYFRGEPGPLLYPQNVTLPELWAALQTGDALTIPHHTGKFPKGVDLTVHNAELRRNFEMYSGHGLSEVYDPSHPLAFEFSKFTSDAKSLDSPSHIQDAWRMGLHLSAIAASDDHRAHPGIAMYGLAAIRAKKLTRNEIFQGLYDRHTYATTGAKIILHFDVNGTPMGQTAPHQETTHVNIRAHGTDTIEFVELLRYQPGDATFSVVQRWEPKTLDFETMWEDAESKPDAIYYTRLRQRKLIHKRIAMAWSSPVWVEK